MRKRLTHYNTRFSAVYKSLAGIVALLVLISCGKKEVIPAELSITPGEIDFAATGGAKQIIVNSSASWSIANPVTWLEVSHKQGNEGETVVTISPAVNSTGTTRTGVVTVNATNGQARRLMVKQESTIYPSYNLSPKEPDVTGMNSTAQEIASKIVLGWNIGNTLEATGGETAWGNPKVSEDLIKLVKQNGFNAIRIPCSWDQYASKATAKIDEAWLNRIKEVVQLCVKNGVYTIINIHWDGGWLENNVTPEKRDSVAAKQKAYWEQIATHFRDFDEHLLFAGANEPNVKDQAAMKILESHHQAFVDAVRSTGGRNSYRVLIVQGPDTDIEKTSNWMTSLPTDPIPGRLMAEVHYYTPFNFCLMTKDESWGKMFYYWGRQYRSVTSPDRNASAGLEEDMDRLFRLMKVKFADKGVPVILGEFDAVRRSNLTGTDLRLHLDSRSYYFRYLVSAAKRNGMLPFYWDIGNGVFNRVTQSVSDRQALDSLRNGAGLLN